MRSFAHIVGKFRSGEMGAVLAPMAGVTDLGMRRAAQQFGASYTVSEMILDRFCVEREASTDSRSIGEGLDCHVVQIAGCVEGSLADAARFAEAKGADAIDINMGCPAKKVVGGQAGSALMRDPARATLLIRAVVAAVSIPVTLKMRLGWDDSARTAPELARRAEGEGVCLVTVHGRTRCQFYQGKADWSAIRAVVDAVSVPVVANGDCAGTTDAREMLSRSGAAAVMVGRAALGRPWLVGEIAHELATGRRKPQPSLAQRRECALTHLEALLSRYGQERGLRHARKHLAAYASGAGWPPGTRDHLSLVTTTDPVMASRLLGAMFDDGDALELAA